ncbi:hypothetical protein MAR_026730 [Mya arenaria]|uniref:Uncharacterized protein n=1 Tax=Mya arenaria TaxID=6604 RepID=A0ABY7ETD5_MYAAR|nr:hypothetical protein MAR_026730 [Mya arenaria]
MYCSLVSHEVNKNFAHPLLVWMPRRLWAIKVSCHVPEGAGDRWSARCGEGGAKPDWLLLRGNCWSARCGEGGAEPDWLLLRGTRATSPRSPFCGPGEQRQPAAPEAGGGAQPGVDDQDPALPRRLPVCLRLQCGRQAGRERSTPVSSGSPGRVAPDRLLPGHNGSQRSWLARAVLLMSVLISRAGYGLASMVDGIVDRYDRAAEDPPQVLYVDRDCCGDSEIHRMFHAWPLIKVHAHILYPLFMSRLSKAIFEWSSEDLEKLKEAPGGAAQQRGHLPLADQARAGRSAGVVPAESRRTPA